jgi:hypothetical protein
MALVVWVYAGGGYAEAEGIVPLLKKHFADVTFQRRTPAHRRPGPRPSVVEARGARTYAGNTGVSFQKEIQENLKYWFEDGPADLIIVLDDSDCNPPDAILEGFEKTVTDSLNAMSAEPLPPIVAGLAVPELEVWLLGDWEMTFGKAYPLCEKSLQQELVRRGVYTSEPEKFVCRPNQQTYIKLSSDVLLPAIEKICAIRFSKATDTPKLLLQIRPQTVKARCGYFRQLWGQLEKHIS